MFVLRCRTCGTDNDILDGVSRYVCKGCESQFDITNVRVIERVTKPPADPLDGM